MCLQPSNRWRRLCENGQWFLALRADQTRVIEHPFPVGVGAGGIHGRVPVVDDAACGIQAAISSADVFGRDIIVLDIWQRDHAISVSVPIPGCVGRRKHAGRGTSQRQIDVPASSFKLRRRGTYLFVLGFSAGSFGRRASLRHRCSACRCGKSPSVVYRWRGEFGCRYCELPVHSDFSEWMDLPDISVQPGAVYCRRRIADGSAVGIVRLLGCCDFAIRKASERGSAGAGCLPVVVVDASGHNPVFLHMLFLEPCGRVESHSLSPT